MAGFTRTHGDSQPVFAIDVQNGPVASTANANGTPTNFVGPAFDFFGLDLGAAPTTQLGVNGAISAVNQAIEQLATVSVTEARLISIQVWDKANTPLIENAIQKSELGINPQIDGQLIRLPVPDLNEERRTEIKKLIVDALRNIRFNDGTG